MSRKPTGPGLPKAPSTSARELRHHDSPAVHGAATRDIKSPMPQPPGAGEPGGGGPGGGGPGGGGPGGGGVNPGGGDPADSNSIPVAINCIRRTLH